MMGYKVLVVATSSKTRGGITSVINAYKPTFLWDKWNCIWIETHIDKSILYKLYYMISSLIKYLCLLPFSKIVHIHLSAPTSVKRKLLYLSLAKLFNKKVIIHFHAFSETSRVDTNYINLYRRVFKSADILIVLSKSWKESIVNDLNISPDKIEIVYNPCQNIDTTNKFHKAKYILYAGTLNKRKNYGNLIKAFALIANQITDWKLVFAGNGELDKAKSLVAEYGIEKQVIFKGWISGQEKEEAFLNASIFCLPSYAEGFPMAVLDAFSYGIPVITTPVGGLPDVAIDGENMLLFNPSNIEELSIKLLKLIEDETLQSKLSDESLFFANNKFSLKDITSQIDKIYIQLSAKESLIDK